MMRQDGRHLTCVLCNEVFASWGNNACPLAEGLCCDDCNYRVVMARHDVIVEDLTTEEEKRNCSEESLEFLKEQRRHLQTTIDHCNERRQVQTKISELETQVQTKISELETKINRVNLVQSSLEKLVEKTKKRLDKLQSWEYIESEYRAMTKKK